MQEARTLAAAAYERASETGHDMAPLETDEESGGHISYCHRCDGFLVVDLWEGPEAYGRATTGPCPGKPPHQPAPRREQSIQAARYAEPMVVCSWTADEVAWVQMMVPSDKEGVWS